jgi:hypothetical protein
MPKSIPIRQSYSKHLLLGGAPSKLQREILYPPPPDNNMVRGQLVHALAFGALGVSVPRITPVPFDSFRPDAARKIRDAAFASGEIPMLETKLEPFSRAAAAVAEAVESKFGFDLESYSCERRVDWATSHGIAARSTIDIIGHGIIIDLKCPSDASPSSFQPRIFNDRIHIQAAAYCEVSAQEDNDLTPCEEYWVLAQEAEPPYANCWYLVTRDMVQLGEMQWTLAQRRWAALPEVDAGPWPHYNPVVVEPTSYQIERARVIPDA